MCVNDRAKAWEKYHLGPIKKQVEKAVELINNLATESSGASFTTCKVIFRAGT